MYMILQYYMYLCTKFNDITVSLSKTTIIYLPLSEQNMGWNLGFDGIYHFPINFYLLAKYVMCLRCILYIIHPNHMP